MTMPSATNLVISTRGLSKSYRGVAAVQDLDLQVPRHAIFGFLGPKWAIPTIATALWVILFVSVALWRFAREEF